MRDAVAIAYMQRTGVHGATRELERHVPLPKDHDARARRLRGAGSPGCRRVHLPGISWRRARNPQNRAHGRSKSSFTDVDVMLEAISDFVQCVRVLGLICNGLYASIRISVYMHACAQRILHLVCTPFRCAFCKDKRICDTHTAQETIGSEVIGRRVEIVVKSPATRSVLWFTATGTTHTIVYMHACAQRIQHLVCAPFRCAFCQGERIGDTQTAMGWLYKRKRSYI